MEKIIERSITEKYVHILELFEVDVDLRDGKRYEK